MKNQIINSLLTAILLTCAICTATANTQEKAATKSVSPPPEIWLEHDALGKAPTVNVQIGKKIYPFSFDTDGDITAWR